MKTAVSLVAEHLNELDGVAGHPYALLDPDLADEAKSHLNSMIESREKRGKLLNEEQERLVGRHGEIII